MIKNFSPQSTIAESIVSSKYNQQIDIMKGLAILLVVAGHIIQFSVVGGVHLILLIYGFISSIWTFSFFVLDVCSVDLTWKKEYCLASQFSKKK